MATSNLIGNLAGGNMVDANKGMANLGIPVMNNQGAPSAVTARGQQDSGPILNAGGTIMGQPVQPAIGGTIIPPHGMAPTQTALNTGSVAPNPISSGSPIPIQQPLGSTAPPQNTAANPSAPFANMTAQQQQQLLKQLKDTFGKGEGSLLDSLIGSIGGSDDAYMQAFMQALQGPTAENLATLNTTLGNSGIGMDSSTAAIANADYMSNVTSQIGLQEQQLKQNDLQQLMALTQGLQGASVAEVSSGGFFNDLASVTSSIGNLIPFGSGGNKGNAGNVTTNPGAGQAGLSQGLQDYASAPLGEGAIPLGGTDTSSLPDLSGYLSDSSSAADLIGMGVFV